MPIFSKDNTRHLPYVCIGSRRTRRCNYAIVPRPCLRVQAGEPVGNDVCLISTPSPVNDTLGAFNTNISERCHRDYICYTFHSLSNKVTEIGSKRSWVSAVSVRRRRSFRFRFAFVKNQYEGLKTHTHSRTRCFQVAPIMPLKCNWEKVTSRGFRKRAV